VLEGTTQQFVRSLQGEAGQDTPLARAQELVYQACEEPDADRRARLARDALDVCPDCSDAYVLLAEDARSRREALELYRQGVAAGERALGPETFQRSAGSFWGVLPTRPYMRARLGLAHTLWTAGRRDEAVAHLQEMLRLNPSDNQGVRYTLAGFLLFLDRDDELVGLLDRYPDEASAAWAYTKALLAFRRQGDTIEARRLLQAARKANRHVPDCLLGRKFPSAEPPGAYRLGDESEALNYVGSFLVSWKSTPGAVAWLRANEGKRKPAPAQARGPLGFVKKWLKERLPQAPDVWQADLRQTPNWIRLGGDPARPWVVLVTSRSNDLVLAHQITEAKPTPALLWDVLVGAMQHPAAGEAHRPTDLQVRPGEPWESLRPHVEEVGVTLTAEERLDHFETVFADMTEHLGGKREPGLLDVPGVQPEQVAAFYEAAATFFRRAPWKKVGYEAAIKVECDRFHGGPWYAVLMGQSGLTNGLALYEDLETLRRMFEGGRWRANDDEQNARQTVATSVTFGEEWTVPTADLDAARRYGWPVARPDAWPEVIHKERGLSVRPPLAWELELVEGCLRAVPDFVDRRKKDDPTREEFTVQTASGSLKLALSWVVEENG
jgi:tetratricopeptide (TPR) repeat protein